MQNARLDYGLKRKLFRQSKELFAALDVELTEEQKARLNELSESRKKTLARSKERSREYYYAHREEINAKRRAKMASETEEEKEERRAAKRAYYAAHREEIREQNRQKYAENPEKYRKPKDKQKEISARFWERNR